MPCPVHFAGAGGDAAAARRLNEVNRQVRNLLAANVAARLDALTRSPGLYTGPRARTA